MVELQRKASRQLLDRNPISAWNVVIGPPHLPLCSPPPNRASEEGKGTEIEPGDGVLKADVVANITLDVFDDLFLFVFPFFSLLICNKRGRLEVAGTLRGKYQCACMQMFLRMCAWGG